MPRERDLTILGRLTLLLTSVYSTTAESKISLVDRVLTIKSFFLIEGLLLKDLELVCFLIMKALEEDF